MSKTRCYPTSAAERYDRSLSRSRHKKPLPAGTPVPRPTSEWPPENVILLEKYRNWLTEGGYATVVINQHRLPMAGHVLGFALKPHQQINFKEDFEAPMRYIEAKGVSDSWRVNCRRSLDYFRDFLREERGIVTFNPPQEFGNAAIYQEGLPSKLLQQLTRFLHLRQAGWRASRIPLRTYQYWYKYAFLWRWLFQNGYIEAISDLTRDHLHHFVDEMLVKGYKVSTINNYLQTFQSTLRYLEEIGETIPHGLLSFRSLKKPTSLPRSLNRGEVQTLLNDFAQRVEEAKTVFARRMSQLDHAAFVLLWQTGLRVGELEDLRLGDLDRPSRNVVVRAAKGLEDRVVYLTDRVVDALESYLAVRGPAQTDHLFIFRHKRLSKDLIRHRLKMAGERTGIKVTPHMLRHTFATELVNAGCPMPTIQKLLGHERLQTTLVYARVHDATVASDYLQAMGQIEGEMIEMPSLHQAVEEWL